MPTPRTPTALKKLKGTAQPCRIKIAENARLAAAFYNGFARLLEGDDDNEMGFRQFAEVFEIMARYDEDMSRFDLILLAYLADGYEAEHDGDFDRREAYGLGLALKNLVDRIGAAKLTEEQIAALQPTGQSWDLALAAKAAAKAEKAAKKAETP